ncbi:conjugal transfer mating pair stabilization protein TraG [Chromobacterium alkanivorans]|uniref:conjugal transfer protein TraG N-terminal domain-containing protein n=1 Tax=Chromobacterium alkanivorans TaxID=1071719 RepID=UPI002166FB04|nr:conjugal transfer protein TraG N-terminal domain-containing protein [Chromobacterium alkanivorans]MCS3805829.1 conjugal transfer mating pair stabilization protein TraG [Chromobacterium alkanivorans]MCS3820168.1 conjugal transfer mating pair stabilization protein TraG [Chromobacterium alkanivorans]MCS3874925.1 conjugal transfer mating pair stabilization protein TraG [Chromobacterium alkanivorans]
MFDFNIYVLGDVSSFQSALNAVAMTFNQKGFLNSAFMVGGLVMLISAILFMIGKQSDGSVPGVMGPVSGMFGLFAVVWTSTIPTSVIVNDIYTGNAAKIDNVPLIVSLPAGAFTTAGYKIFDLANTTYQSVNGSYMGVSQNGFVMPLKLLFSLRRGIERADVNIAASLKSFILDCTANSNSFSMKDLQRSADAINYVLTHARDSGLTNYFSKAYPNGTPVSCNEAAASISQDINVSFLSGTNSDFTEMLNTSMREKNPLGAKFQQSDVENVLDTMLPGTWKAAIDANGVAQDTRGFMLNALAFNTLTNTFNCMGSNTDIASFNACNIQLTQAFEQSRNDAAAAGSFFTKMMMPAMVFMQIMFFSFAPLIVIYGVMKGGGALGMYVKYLLFGVWTSSWLPFSAVIQMYIQNDVSDKLEQIPASMLTLGNFAQIYYDVLASRLSVASDMLAATPLVSLAMLTGSAMAVTSLAGRWSGRDHVDEKQTSPDIMRTGPITDIGSAAQLGPSITGNQLLGMVQAGASLRSHSTASTIDNAITSASSQVSSARAEVASSFEKSLNWMKSQGSGWRSADSDAAGISRDYSERTSKVRQAAEVAAKEANFSEREMHDFKMALNGSAGIKSPFGGVEASVSTARGVTTDKAKLERFANSLSTLVGSDQAWAKTITTRAQHAFETYTGADKKTAQGLATALRQSTARMQSSEQRLQETVGLSQSANTSFTTRDDQMGAQLLTNPAARFELERRHQELEQANNQNYLARLGTERTRLARAGDIRNGEDVARFNALEGMGEWQTTASVLSMLSGINGPSKFDAEANRGVAPAANAVATDPSQSPLMLRDPHVIAEKPAAPPAPGAGHHMPPSHGSKKAIPAVGGQNVPSTTGDQQRPDAHVPNKEVLETRSRQLANKVMPSFDGEMAAVQGQLSNADEKIKAAQERVHDHNAILQPEQIRDSISLKPFTNAVAGLGMKWQQFEQEHPVIAGGIETALTVIPAVRAGGALLKLGRAGSSAWASVEASKEGVRMAGKEVVRLSSAIRTEGSALTGMRQVVDPRRVAELGFRNEGEFLKAYESAQSTLMAAEKGVLTKAQAFAKEYGAKLGKDNLPQDASLQFIAGKTSHQAVGVARSSAPGAVLQLAQYESQLRRQDIQVAQNTVQLHRSLSTAGH